MLRRKIGFLLNIFSMITSCMVIAVALFVTVLNPIERIEAVILWQIPAVAALISLTSLIHPWDIPLKKAGMAARIIIHYVLVNIIVLGAGYAFDWYNPKSGESVTAMVVSIAVIFAIVSGISWGRSARDARRMNERLQEYMKNPVDKSLSSMYNESVREEKPH